MYVVCAGASLYAMRRASADRQLTAIGIWSTTGTQLSRFSRISRVIPIYRDMSVKKELMKKQY